MFKHIWHKLITFHEKNILISSEDCSKSGTFGIGLLLSACAASLASFDKFTLRGGLGIVAELPLDKPENPGLSKDDPRFGTGGLASVDFPRNIP